MTERALHLIALVLSIAFGALAAYRIHRGELFESGTMLRLGIFLLAVWRAFGDLHELTDWFNWSEVLYEHTFRNIVSEIILTIALLADLWRHSQRERVSLKTQALMKEVLKEKEGL